MKLNGSKTTKLYMVRHNWKEYTIFTRYSSLSSFSIIFYKDINYFANIFYPV